MEFPWTIPIGSFRLSVHLLAETLAYSIGLLFYRFQRAQKGDAVSYSHRSYLLAAAIVGAVIGAKGLHLLHEWRTVLDRGIGLEILFGGKTLVGGILGGWAAVEIVKKRLGIFTRTGDLYAAPLALAIAIGRLGCFSAGVHDHTHGLPSDLPWAMDLGDGVRRHPAALYEAIFAAGLFVVLIIRGHRPHVTGRLFQDFLLAYLFFRVVVEFAKPADRIFGVSVIQAAAAIGWVVAYRRRFSAESTVEEKA